VPGKAQAAMGQGSIVSILCKFWLEDQVWNGIAEHLPIAAFGHTFEEAKENLEGAILSHLEALRDAGKS
jgi:predicted RNase H-like HicB family nuclease